MRKILFVTALLLLSTGRSMVFATEGMWLPQLLEVLNEKEMKAMGMKISAKDIYNINKSSLKDAIVSFGGFCTAEVISEQGLLLTNHHCGYDAIQKHSSLQHNYLENGFWAASNKEELANPGLTATFIVSITDVTDKVLAGVGTGVAARERQSLIDKNLNTVRTSTKVEAWQEILIRPFFEANKYYLFITETFKDVRLVGAPPSAIGKFGSDTDNWMWPRHTGDFSLFRIYADVNNRPAAYASTNVPYKPKKALSISLDGLEENDFTMVFGFPGRTQEYLYSAALQQIADKQNPVKIEIRNRALNITDKYMRSNPAIKIQYASKYASTANAWKKWMGESIGLKSTDAINKKQVYEAEFVKRVQGQPLLKNEYGGLMDSLKAAYAAFEDPAYYRDIFTETFRNIEFLSLSNRLIPVVNAVNQGEAAFNKAKEDFKTYALDYFKNYAKVVDQDVAQSLLAYYKEKMPAVYLPAVMQKNGPELQAWIAGVFSGSALTDSAKMMQLLDRPMTEILQSLMRDQGLMLASEMARLYNENNGVINAAQQRVNNWQTVYMKAQMEVLKEKRFYPDANSTLRVTYGKAQGYAPRDAVNYKFYTYLDGVMEKYIPGDYEFDVPEKLIDLYNKKDYGPYAVKGKMPVCFIASNHTTGGNSGSPALDAWGNLVGLNFDRVWEGTMSDINYDASICRNIMVDVRYILFIIDKYAGAGHLIKEMKLVHPKKK